MNTRLKDLRIDHDLTQQQVGEILHVTQRTYAYYESGERKISIDALVILASYYGTSVDYLLYLTDVKTPYPKERIQKIHNRINEIK